MTCKACGCLNRVTEAGFDANLIYECGSCGAELSTRSSAKNKRFFKNDVFLSHNQGDGSAALARTLQERGARAWHDGDADMSDQNVQQLVMRALRQSRFVCVCVGPSFRYSEWVEAECKAALAIQQQAGVYNYMIVAELAPNPSIPPVLAQCRRFSIHADGPDALASFVRAGNHRQDVATPVVVHEVAEMRDEARRMRSRLSQAQKFDLSEPEQLKLFLARMRAMPRVEQASTAVGEFALDWSRLTQPYSAILGWGPLTAGQIYQHVKAGDSACLDQCADVLSCLAERPDLCAALWSSAATWRINLEVTLDALAALAGAQSHRARARAAYSRILASASTAKQMPRAVVDVYERWLAARIGGQAFDLQSALARAGRSRPRAWLAPALIALALAAVVAAIYQS